jgi:hypothetical protein
MKKLNFIVFLFTIIFLCFSGTSISSELNTFNFQGRLESSNGLPISSTVNMTFRLYDDQSNNLWFETANVNVTDGEFDVLLGTSNPIGFSVNEQARYLGFAVENDSVMTPLQDIGGVLRAGFALSIADAAITTSKLSGTGGSVLSSGTSGQSLISNGDETFSWQTITESDPQVGSLSTYYVPRWSGSYLTNGSIYDNGSVLKIGTTSSYAKLTISGYQNKYFSNYGYLYSGGGTGKSNGTNAYSIYASHRIACSEFNAFSDIRIKSIIGKSNSEKDLETLLKLEISDYTYIDTISKGDKVHKKLIAQDVEKVYPEAVSTLTSFIPDIYALSEKIDYDNGLLIISLKEPHNLEPGEKVALMSKNGQIQKIVQAVDSAYSFTVDSDISYSSVFVYGKEVDDFKTIDYEAISMLNVSATQALFRTIQSQQELIQQQNNKIAELEEQLTNISKALINKGILDETDF